LHQLCQRIETRAGFVACALVGVLLALHITMVIGIARTISSGEVAMPVMSRLDVKRDDPAPPIAEPWFPAYGVDRSGALLCEQTRGAVLHGTYAYLEDTYFGLDHRLGCGAREVQLLGAEPAAASHWSGLSLPLWARIAAQPERVIGGLGIARVA